MSTARSRLDRTLDRQEIAADLLRIGRGGPALQPAHGLDADLEHAAPRPLGGVPTQAIGPRVPSRLNRERNVDRRASRLPGPAVVQDKKLFDGLAKLVARHNRKECGPFNQLAIEFRVLAHVRHRARIAPTARRHRSLGTDRPAELAFSLAFPKYELLVAEVSDACGYFQRCASRLTCRPQGADPQPAYTNSRQQSGAFATSALRESCQPDVRSANARGRDDRIRAVSHSGRTPRSMMNTTALIRKPTRRATARTRIRARRGCRLLRGERGRV